MPKKRIEEVKITKELGFAFINNITNIASHEWPRVIYCFLLKFFVDTGKVIGHTILLSMVASRLGIRNLPLVLVVSGVLVMISTTFFSRLLYKIEKRYLILSLAFSAALLLLVSRFVLSLDVVSHASSVAHTSVIEHIGIFTYLFFAVYLFAEAVLFVQLEIILALYIEEYFTPLESQRTFPIIESAPIFAGIFGGSLISFLHLKTPNYIYIWAASLFMVVLVIYVYKKIINKDIEISHTANSKIKKSLNIVEGFKKNIRLFRKSTYIKSLAIVVFLSFAILEILEFEYTRAIAGITGGESELTHGLGAYILIFSTVALLIQFLMSSRIIRNFGIINSMILNPLFSLMGFFMSLFFINPAFIISSKFIFDSTSVVYKNAYLSSFYAIKHNIREKIKVLIEGWIMPLGIIVGTLIVFILEMFINNYADLILKIIMLIFVTIMIVVLFRQRKEYTSIVVRNLNSLSVQERYNAIEILGEQGHVNNLSILTSKLGVWIENNKAVREKIKILETFGRLKEESTIPVILDCFDDKNKKVRLEAIRALSNFKNLGKQFYTQTFARFRIVNTLKELFEKENSKTIKSEIIKVFANLNRIEVVPFLLKILKEANPEIKADCIYVIGQFHDANIAYYLKPFLKDKNPYIRANTIVALWQFKNLRLDLILDLTQMLDEGSDDKDMLLSGVYAVGELKAKQEMKKLLELVRSDDLQIRRYSAVALAKLGNKESIPYIIDLIFNEGGIVALKTKKMLSNLSLEMKKKLKHLIEQKVSFFVNKILEKNDYKHNNLSKDELEKMIHHYNLIDEEKELIKLEQILDNK